MDPKRKTWSSIAGPAYHAFRANWLAITLIQLFALLLVISYYRVDSMRDWLGVVAQWKAQGGPLFTAVATMISGGFIPEAMKRILRPTGVRFTRGTEFIHQLGFWIIIGLLVDYFYQLQALMFGHGTDLTTLLIKVLVDQLGFTLCISMPFTILWFSIWDSGYQWKKFIQLCNLQRVVRRSLELWTLCLSFWPVMLLVIYSLPQLLQFPLFLFGNAAYSILMIFVVRHQASSSNSTKKPFKSA